MVNEFCGRADTLLDELTLYPDIFVRLCTLRVSAPCVRRLPHVGVLRNPLWSSSAACAGGVSASWLRTARHIAEGWDALLHTGAGALAEGASILCGGAIFVLAHAAQKKEEVELPQTW